MKKAFKNTVLGISVVFSLAGCSSDKNDSKVKISMNDQMQSDELTAAGEQLLAPHTLHLADQAFAMALQKNPNDKKAQFYRVFLKRFMVFRGIGARIQPLVEKYGSIKEFNRKLKELPNSPIRDFLLKPAAGAANFQNEEDVQGVLVEYRTALQDFRTFVALNQDLKMDLYINPLLIVNRIQENIQGNCIISGSEDNTQIECDKTDIATVKVNIADLMALKQEAAGEILYLTLATSYNLNGAYSYAREIENQKISAKDSMDLAFKRVNLKLMPNQGMTAIRDLGADLVVAAKWALKYQDSLCGKSSTKPRREYAFQNLCIPDASLFEKNIAILEQVLRGPMAVDIGDDTQPKVTKTLNYLALFDKPVADLRSLAPATWNQDGSFATSMSDKSFGGLLPNQDADFFFSGNK